MEPPWAVVVDRNPASRALMSEVLEEQGFSVHRAEDAQQAVDALSIKTVSLVSFGFESGHNAFGSVIDHAMRLTPQPLLVGLGDPGTDDPSDTVNRLFDLVPAPIGRAALERMVRRCKSRLGLLARLDRMQDELQRRHGFRGFVGRSESMQRLRGELERLSRTDDPVWITGEPGTGKESAARFLHAGSVRCDGAFVLIDCAGVSQLDSFMAPGGEFARGEGGTVFLEELPALRMDLQEDLMRAIGLHRARAAQPPSGARFVIGSRIDPARARSEGRLLPELQRQLGAAVIAIPPLRDRREEIALLADYFLSQICEINHLRRIHLSHGTVAHLERYVWPGNVEQLRGAIEQAAIVVRGDVIEQADLPGQVREFYETSTATEVPDESSKRAFRDAKRDVVEAFERSYLDELLDRHGGNVTAASQQAGMLRSALQRLLRKYGLKSAEFRRRRRSGVRVATSEPSDGSR